MPTPRKSTQALEASGAFNKDPQRAKNRGETPISDQPLGDCPPWFLPGQVEAWGWITSQAAPGVLLLSDTQAVTATAILVDMVRSGVAGASHFGQLGAYLDRLGMSPKARGNVSIPKAPRGKGDFDLDA